MRDINSDLKAVQLLGAQDITASTYTKYIDLQGFESAEIIVNIGAATPLSGSNYMTPTLKEAASAPTASGSYSTVATADQVGAFTAVDAQDEDETTQQVGYVGSSRYLAVQVVETGTVTAFNVSVDVILGTPRHAPAGTSPSSCLLYTSDAADE